MPNNSDKTGPLTSRRPPTPTRPYGRTLLLLLVAPASGLALQLSPHTTYRSVSAQPARAVVHGKELSAEEQTAIRWRISQLRSEIWAAEREVDALKTTLGAETRPGLVGAVARASETLTARVTSSLLVFVRQLQRQENPIAYLSDETFAGLRLASNFSLARGYLAQSERLVTHAPAIYARIAQLEPYAPGLLSVVETWLPVIEPHLDEILERLDDIEPHLPWVIEHIDVLAPHCGALLRHMDALLLYAQSDGDDSLSGELIEYVPYFAPRLDALGPHLALLRPHMPLLLPHMRVIARQVDAFLPFVSVSANADVLLYYFGWVLRVPLLRRLIFLPGVPRLVAKVCKWLPKRPVRGTAAWSNGRLGGTTGDLLCDWEGCDSNYVVNAAKYYQLPTSAFGGLRRLGRVSGGREVQSTVLAAVLEARASASAGGGADTGERQASTQAR